MNEQDAQENAAVQQQELKASRGATEQGEPIDLGDIADQLEYNADRLRVTGREGDGYWFTAPEIEAMVVALRKYAASETATHTDHPARHWDRTCPACVNSAPSAGASTTPDDVGFAKRWLRWHADGRSKESMAAVALAEFDRLERELAEANTRAARWEEAFHMSVHAPQTSATAQSAEVERTPDAYLVRARGSKGEYSEAAFVFSDDAEEDARQWRMNGRSTEIHPLYLKSALSATVPSAELCGTPRTDAARLSIYERQRFAKGDGVMYELVPADFARQLERELAIERATNATLGKTVDALREQMKSTPSATAATSRDQIIEECARVCETDYTTWDGCPTVLGERFAKAIRALKNAAPPSGHHADARATSGMAADDPATAGKATAEDRPAAAPLTLSAEAKPFAWVLVDKDGNRERWSKPWLADGGFDPNEHPHGIYERDEVAPFGPNKDRAPFRWMPLYTAPSATAATTREPDFKLVNKDGRTFIYLTRWNIRVGELNTGVSEADAQKVIDFLTKQDSGLHSSDSPVQEGK